MFYIYIYLIKPLLF